MKRRGFTLIELIATLIVLSIVALVVVPELYESVKEITIDFLNKNNIKALVLDVDNTILDFDKKIPEGIKEWCQELKEQGIKFCI